MQIMHCCLIRRRIPIKLILLLIFIVLLCGYLLPRPLTKNESNTKKFAPIKVSKNNISKLVTVVFHQYEEFENDIAESVQSFVSAYPNVSVLVLCDKAPYPPFPFSASKKSLRNVKIIPTSMSFNAPFEDSNPLTHISTDYVFFVPDSTRVAKQVLQKATMLAIKSGSPVVVGIGKFNLLCLHVKFDYYDWLMYYKKASLMKACDIARGPHALLINTEILHRLPRPFARPFPEALYLQSRLKNITVQIFDGRLQVGRSVLRSPTARQKALRKNREQRTLLFREVGVKALVKEDGTWAWFGCKKETQRCFPPTQGIPSFILAKRNMPPCCRRNLRETASHVLKTLAQAGVRFWLESTTLLGAILYSDILPWHEYVEIGVYESDLKRVPLLGRGGEDKQGFVWERATKGQYYQVAFSATNKIYVIILPFRSKNGTMWPVDWVFEHQKEFPERHLHPMAQIKLGMYREPAPNDAHDFLSHKLGKSAIEMCRAKGPYCFYSEDQINSLKLFHNF